MVMLRTPLNANSVLSSFEPLEPRQLLAVNLALSDAWTTGGVDYDGDGRFRQVEVWFQVNATGTGSRNFYVDVYEDDGEFGDDLLVRSSTFNLAAGASKQVGVVLPADLMNLPGDEPDGPVCEFELRLVDADTRQVIQIWTPQNDADLGNIPMETSVDDRITGQVAPTLSTFTTNPNSSAVLVQGSTVYLRTRVQDDAGADFVLFFIDKNNNGRPDPGFDLIVDGMSWFGSRVLGTNVDGYWQTEVTVTPEWGRGMVTIAAIAADAEGNYSNVVTSQVRINSAPVALNLTANVPNATYGRSTTLTATVSDPDSNITGVTFYFDKNGDGVFNSSDDISFGFITNRNSDGSFSVNFTAMENWGVPSGRFYANVRDAEGLWGANPVTLFMTFNRPPRVDGANPFVNGEFGPPYVLWGQTLEIRASVYDTGPLARVTAFFDANADGLWTDGVDIALPDAVQSGNSWRFLIPIDSRFGTPAAGRFVVDAQDADGAWASQRQTAAIRVNDPPRMVALNVPPSASVGQPLRLTAVVEDSSPALVTFFIDRDFNGVWTPGIDVDLGSDSTPSDGFFKDVTVLSSWAGPIQFGANVRDTPGAWAPTPAVSGIVNISAGPLVARLDTTSGDVVTAGESITLTAIVSAGVPLRAVTFFFDRNGNGAWDAGTDVDLGADNDATGGWTRTFTVPSTWGNVTGARFVANAVNNQNQWGAVTARTSTFSVSMGPVVTALTVSASSVNPNQQFTLTATVVGGTTARAVTFFYDANGNGRWDAGVDTDLGADFNAAGGWSITTTGRSTWAGTLNGRFVANAVNTSDVWGAFPRQSDAVRINDVPVIVSAQGSPATVAFNTNFQLQANVRDAFGVGVVTFFMDVDGDGRWTPGVDVDFGVGSLLTGTTTNGLWAKATKAAWTPGIYRFVADARDSDGVWSGRPVSFQITVVA